MPIPESDPSQNPDQHSNPVDPILDKLFEVLKAEAGPDHPDVTAEKSTLEAQLRLHHAIDHVITEAQIHGEEELSQAQPATDEEILAQMRRYRDRLEFMNPDESEEKRELADIFIADVISILYLLQDLKEREAVVQSQLSAQQWAPLAESLFFKKNSMKMNMKNISEQLNISGLWSVEMIDNFREDLLDRSPKLMIGVLAATGEVLQELEDARNLLKPFRQNKEPKKKPPEPSG